MKAVTYQGEKSVHVEDVAEPTIVAPGDAIVRVQLCAVCGSDLHVYHGRERGLDHGCVMGHEFVGEIVALGSETSGLALGDRVLSPFSTSCGDCRACRAGLTSRCVAGQLFGWVAQGQGLQGAQAEFVRVPLATTTLLKVGADVSDTTALLLGDVFSTGYFCAEQALQTRGAVCAVIGCGPVGLCAILGALQLGAERVYALDQVPRRLELAAGFGAIPIDIRDGHAVATVLEATQGDGVDAVLEGVGNAAAHRTAIELVRSGGTISVVGVHNEDSFSFTPAEAYDKNLTYRVGRCPARRLAAELLPRMQSLGLDLDAILTHSLPLRAGAEAYRLFDEKRDGCIKVVLTP